MAMSLTATDLHAIRKIVEEETRAVVQVETPPIVEEVVGKETASLSVKLSSINGKLTALENDVKETYDIITKLQKSAITDRKFRQHSIKQRVLTLNAELLAVAKDSGITLPRS